MSAWLETFLGKRIPFTQEILFVKRSEILHKEENSMSCQIEPHLIDEIISFHGHSCPGLAIGIRAAEAALNEMNGVDQSDLVCVAETDMCGVDGIQYLTGCTYGKGNFLHRDYGKMAFSFYNRKSGKGIRLLFRPEATGELNGEMSVLMEKSGLGTITVKEQEHLNQLRNNMQERLMKLPIEKIFVSQQLNENPPRPARIMESLVCQDCGENTMESRTRRFAGRTLCIPCFSKVEQKV